VKPLGRESNNKKFVVFPIKIDIIKNHYTAEIILGGESTKRLNNFSLE
jgi:hypothetical protein